MRLNEPSISSRTRESPKINHMNIIRSRFAPAVLLGPLLFLLSFTIILACRKTEASDLTPPLKYAPPLPDGGSVFFVGNSLLGWEGRSLPEWLAALGEARGIQFEAGSDIVPGDLPLAAFLEHDAVKAALASRKYQVWILQGHEYEPVDHPREFYEAVRNFDAKIRASGGRTVLFMTWEFRWRRFMDKLSTSYDSIGRELGIPVIPTGLVFRDCELLPPSGRVPFFLTASSEEPSGDIHENQMGMAVSLYSTYAILTGDNPSGQLFVAPGNDIAAEMLKFLSDKSWARAAERLITGDTSSATKKSLN